MDSFGGVMPRSQICFSPRMTRRGADEKRDRDTTACALLMRGSAAWVGAMRSIARRMRRIRPTFRSSSTLARVEPEERLRTGVVPAAARDFVVELLRLREAGEVELQLGGGLEGEAHVLEEMLHVETGGEV